MRPVRIIGATAVAVVLALLAAGAPAQAAPASVTVTTIQVPSYDLAGRPLGTVPVQMTTSPGPLSFLDCDPGYFCVYIHANGLGPQFSYGSGVAGRCLNIGSWLGVDYNNAISSVYNRRAYTVKMFDRSGCENLGLTRLIRSGYTSTFQGDIFNDRASSLYFYCGCGSPAEPEPGKSS